MGQWGDYPSPGMDRTVADAQEGLRQTAAFAARYEDQAREFVMEFGADVLGGHDPVGLPPGGRAWASGNAPFANDTPETPGYG